MTRERNMSIIECMPPYASLHIHLFGGLRLERDNWVMDLPTTQNARLLLAYLLLHPQRELERAFLAGLLWTNLPEGAARRRLSQALWQVRQVFPWVESSRNVIRVQQEGDYWVDVTAFDQALALARRTDEINTKIEALTEAVSLYHGPLLPGFYKDWVLLTREQYRESYLKILDELIQALMRLGRYKDALPFAQRLTVEEPLNENAHNQLIRLYALLGRQDKALRQYDVLRRVLADELGARPGPATERLIAQVHKQKAGYDAGDTAPLFAKAAVLPLVGREQEWAQIQLLLKRVCSGEGAVLILRGETGIGKTRLLSEITQQAQWLGLQLWGARPPQEGYSPPYELWRRAIRPHLSPLRVEQLALEMDHVWLAALAPLLPEIKTWLPHLPPPPHLQGEEEQHRLHEALLRLMHSFARRASVAIVFDDLQWADASSLEALRRVAANIMDVPLLIVLSFRDDEPADERRMSAYLARFPFSPVIIRLVSLSTEATGHLIQAALGLLRPVPRFQQRLYQVTGGHPLFVLETLRALHEQGILYRDAAGLWSTPWDETTVDYAELPLTTRLQELFERRLAQITPVAHSVIQVAALTNEPFGIKFLCDVLDESPQALLYAIEELLHYHLLAAEGRYLRLVHDSLRDSICDHLEPDEMRSMHRRIAQAFIEQGDVSPAVLAYHLSMARSWREAIHFHLLAAQQAKAMSGYNNAREHLDVVLELAERLGWSDEARFEALAQHEAVLDVLGERDIQAKDLDAMLSLARGHPEREGLVQLRRARFLTLTARFAEAEQAARSALALASQCGGKRLELDALLEMSQTFVFWSKYDLALELQDRLLRLAYEVNDPQVMARVNREMGDVLLGLGRHEEARPYLEKALSLYREHDDRRGEADSMHLLAILATEQGDIASAREYYEQELALSRSIGFLHGETKTLLNMGNLNLLEGRYYRALQQYEAAVALCRQLHNRRAEMMALLNQSAVWLEMFGAEEQAWRHIEEGLELAKEIGDPAGIGQATSLLGEYWLYQEDFDRAERYIRKGVEMLLNSRQYWMLQQDLRLLARLMLARGDGDAALALLDRADEVGREIGAGSDDVMMLSMRGQAYLCKGELDKALRWSQRAMERLGPRVGRGYLVAYEHAQVLQAVGKEKAAERAIGLAWEMLQRSLEDFPPHLRAKSLQQMPDHRRIADALQAIRREIRVRLACIDAPTGRPLREDEWVEVRWTVHDPEDERIRGKVERRRHRLTRLLHEAEQQNTAPTVDDLAAALKVSRATIKRDLAALRQAGVPVRTRGAKARSS
ncbi:MAG TPA: tetratricopeptide repeat protein [Anaerolineae bacterium]|nr:tetratricopeptide repeat protein [Anaerolineae bacterium]